MIHLPATPPSPHARHPSSVPPMAKDWLDEFGQACRPATLPIATASTPPSPDFFVTPFTILRDTREQAPWFFTGLLGDARDKNRPLWVPTRWQSLGNGMGDYTLEGAEDLGPDPEVRWRIAIERKSLPDLFGTILSGRERFEIELANLNRMEYGAVVVEGDWAAVGGYEARHWEEKGLTERERGNRRKTVVRSIAAWQMPGRFPGVRWWLMPGRRAAEVWTFTLLRRFWEKFLKE